MPGQSSYGGTRAWEWPPAELRRSVPGGTLGELLRTLELAEIERRMQEAREQAAITKEAETKARLADPLEFAKSQASVQQFGRRRDVGLEAPIQEGFRPTGRAVPGSAEDIPEYEPNVVRGVQQGFRQTGRTVAGSREQIPEYEPNMVRGVRPVTPDDRGLVQRATGVTLRTRPTQTMLREEAETVQDPNYEAAYAGRRAEASLHPNVMAAEQYAQADTRRRAGTRALTPSIIAAITNLKGAIEQLRTRDPALTQRPGLGGKLEGAVQQGKALLGLDEVATVYDAIGERMIPALARAAGEVGNLAEREQVRYQKLRPKLTDPENVRLEKFKALDELVDYILAGRGASDLIGRMDAFDRAVRPSTASGSTPGLSPGTDFIIRERRPATRRP